MNIKHRNKLQNNKWLNRSKIEWTIEPAKVFKAMHGLDLVSEISSLLIQEIQNETKTNGLFPWKEVCEIVNREKELSTLVIEKVSVTAKTRKLK